MEDHLGPGTGLAAGQVSREGDWGSLYPHQWSIGLLVLFTKKNIHWKIWFQNGGDRHTKKTSRIVDQIGLGVNSVNKNYQNFL